MKKNLQRGFTLIELLVVIAVIGILAGVILASLNSARVKARDAARITTVKQIRSALELYYTDNNVYPLHGAGANNAGYPITTVQPTFSSYLGTISDPNSYIQYVRSTPPAASYGLRVYSERTASWCLVEVGISGSGWWAPPTQPACNF